MTPAEWLKRLNAAWNEAWAPPFAHRYGSRIDAAFRQAPELSDSDVEAAIEADHWRRLQGPDL